MTVNKNLKTNKNRKEETVKFNGYSLTKRKLKFSRGYFEDQFGNKFKAVPCNVCGVLGVESFMRAFHNYGGIRKTTHLCDVCFNEVSLYTERISREKNQIHNYLGRVIK